MDEASQLVRIDGASSQDGHDDGPDDRESELFDRSVLGELAGLHGARESQ
jgi:hypothetical protein